MTIKLLPSVLLIVLAAFATTFAQKQPVDVDQLITELQKSASHTSDELTLVFWIPSEFWRVMLEKEKMPTAQIDEVMGVLRPYTIIGTMDGKVGANGTTTFRSEAEIRSTMRIVDSAGLEYGPLGKDKLGSGATTLLNAMSPIVRKILGTLGENMHFIVFPGVNAKDESIVDARREGSFRIVLAKGREFTWKLPLGALLPAKKCPVDAAKMNGEWRYCPFHGSELKP